MKQNRMKKYAHCDDKTFVISLMYLCKFISINKNIHANWYNIHRLLAVSFLLAQKLNDDTFYSNAHYARICGISLKGMYFADVAAECVSFC